MIDGFRHGFFGVSDVSPWISLAVVGAQPGRWSARSACTCCGSATRSGTEVARQGLSAVRSAAARLAARRPARGDTVTPRGPSPCTIRGMADPTPGHRALHRAGPAVRAPRGRGRRPPFLRDHRLGRVRGHEPRRRHQRVYRGARRPHARADPRAVDEDAHARRVPATHRPDAATASPRSMDKLLIRGGRRSQARSPSPAPRTPRCRSLRGAAHRRAGARSPTCRACTTSRRCSSCCATWAWPPSATRGEADAVDARRRRRSRRARRPTSS